MIKQIKIYNRFNMDMFARTGGLNFPYHNRKWNLISIYGCGDPELLTPEVKRVFNGMGCRDFLSLDFWDITPDWISKRARPSEWEDAILFNKEHASQVLAFLRKLQKDKEDSILVAHCHAGISRSGAIGTFACDYCGLDYTDFIKENSCIMANPYVLKVLQSTTRKKPVNGWHDGFDFTNEGGILIPPWYNGKE